MSQAPKAQAPSNSKLTIGGFCGLRGYPNFDLIWQTARLIQSWHWHRIIGFLCASCRSVPFISPVVWLDTSFDRQGLDINNSISIVVFWKCIPVWETVPVPVTKLALPEPKVKDGNIGLHNKTRQAIKWLFVFSTPRQHQRQAIQPGAYRLVFRE